MIASTIPVGRVGAKTDIAAAVLYLVSPVGSFVSGGVLIVDGGHYLYSKPVMPRETLEMWSKKMEKKSRVMADSKLYRSPRSNGYSSGTPRAKPRPNRASTSMAKSAGRPWNPLASSRCSMSCTAYPKSSASL